MSDERIRKAVNELTVADLDRHPVWEFASDEEDEEGQDETTVRPYPVDGEVDPSAGMLVVRARFHLADGSAMFGYLTPAIAPDHGLGSVQPVITTEQGQVLFWCGAIAPTTDDLEASYRRLGRPAQAVFPIQFESQVPIAGGPVRGEIPGFVVLEDWRTNRTRLAT